MSAITGEDFLGALTVTRLLNTTNINTNSASAFFDVTGYTGKLTIITIAGLGAATATIVPSIKAGRDSNVSNATNWVLNIANFDESGGMNVCNVDLRSSAFGATDVRNNSIFLTWIGVGVGFNTAFTAVAIGQKKSSS